VRQKDLADSQELTFIIKLFVWAQKQTTFQPYISFVRNVTPGHTLAQTTARTNVWQILGSVSDLHAQSSQSSDFGPFRTPPCQCRAPQLNTCWRAKHLHLNKNALDFVGAFH